MALSVAFVLASCGGGEKSAGPSGPTPPAVTPSGTPTGPVVTATIGAAGGTLQSDDASVQLDIPPGALGSDLGIGIQRVTGESPGAVGDAIRLTPHGLQFNVPITVRMPYDSTMVDGSAPELLTIATQQPDGTWLLLAASQVALDTVSRSLVFQTTHFSDYTRLQGLQIRPPSDEIDPGGSVPLTVKRCTTIVDQSTGTASAYAIECEDPAPHSGDHDDELFPLPTFRADPASWAANGAPGGNPAVGFVAGNETSAEYLAPQAPPAGNPVAVSVRVRDNRDRTVSLLVAHIRIRNTCGPAPGARRAATLRDLCAPAAIVGTSSSTIDDAHPLYRISADVRWLYDSAGSIPGSLLSYKAVGSVSFTPLNPCILVTPGTHLWELNDPQSGGTLTLSLPDSTWNAVGIALWTATYTDTCDPNSTPGQAAAGGAWFGGSGRFGPNIVISGTQNVGGQTFTFDFRQEDQ